MSAFIYGVAEGHKVPLNYKTGTEATIEDFHAGRVAAPTDVDLDAWVAGLGKDVLRPLRQLGVTHFVVERDSPEAKRRMVSRRKRLRTMRKTRKISRKKSSDLRLKKSQRTITRRKKSAR